MELNKLRVKQILGWCETYRLATDCKGIVLGISGGKDSTVAAMLAKKVWGDDVYGVIMPNGQQSDIDDAIEVCTTLGIHYRVVNIEQVYNKLIKQTIYPEMNSTDEFFDKISDKAKTNIAPRIRMTILYAIAQTLGYRVMGTGNRSERFIGWFTKWGDGACDLNLLANLTCTEVIEVGLYLAEEFGLRETLIKKEPADGLTGKSDEDNFGFTYAELDKYVTNTSEFFIENETTRKIVDMHKKTKHKLKMPYTVGDYDF